MTEFISIKKDGTCKSVLDKNFEIENLFKKCGFRKNDDFVLVTTKDVIYNGNNYILEVWGRNKGDNSNINLFEFIGFNNKTTIYGTCAVICKLNSNIVNINNDMWDKMYNIIKQSLINDNDNVETNSEFFSDDESECETNDEASDSDSDESSDESVPIYDSELQSEEYNYSS